MFKDSIVYVDEKESHFVRLSDVKPVLEKTVGLPVLSINVGERQEKLEDFLRVCLNHKDQ
jgi:hypothetical protein